MHIILFAFFSLPSQVTVTCYSLNLSFLSNDLPCQIQWSCLWFFFFDLKATLDIVSHFSFVEHTPHFIFMVLWTLHLPCWPLLSGFLHWFCPHFLLVHPSYIPQGSALRCFFLSLFILSTCL